ncbi:MAG TPA: serine/threonine-protein kinase, partial [Myxococcota bacterium]
MRAPGSLVGGRYRIVKKLASGGMGEVYVSQQLPLGREVAVKLVRLDRARDGNIVERFRREAAIVSAISHPNVVTVYDFGVDDDGSLFLAMELLHGSDLRRRLRTGALAIEDALAIARDVALGLAAAHVRGVVHRDLKPENIFLVAPSTPSGTSIAKILDFGVARGGELSHSDDEHGTASATLTSDGATVGTPGYIAPEVALGLRPTAAADHYALGVVLFEALTGQHPFMRDPAESPVATVARQLTELAPLTSSLAPNIPAALDALCTALLARDPATRPQNPAALIEELLASFRAESRASTVAAAAPVSSMRAAARPHSPRAVRIAVIAIGVVALLGLVVASRAWWLSRSPPSSVTIAACIKAKDPRVEALARDALAKEKLWRLSDAAKAWRAALAIEPSYAAANVRIVEMDALRHPAAARDDYRVALAHKRDLCPRDRAFIEAIEPVMRARVDVNDAEQRISAAAHQWPGDVALAILEATAHAAAGHTDAAVATFDRALQQAPPGDALWLAKTQLLADRGRLDDALASLDECLAKNPASVPCGGFKFTLLADAGRCDLASLAAQDFYNMSNDAFAASAVAATMLARGDR